MAPSFSTLPDEILSKILEQVYVEDSESLATLCQVNKQLYHLETAILHRSVNITPLKLVKLSEMDTRGSGGNLRGNVAKFARDVSVKGEGFDRAILAGLLSEMKSLGTIRPHGNKPFRGQS
ncbi:uncharacterized protein PAC_05874 [Phialocephala subalpina]|uniref:Uncharacterized protein n=1 Tax=Phialocephala subalpina TaxID=576137 RepID=A0A1L7WTB2_9HELO|nr:uncharacterized protein PAC_05874 [Phialocephala subalpina]